MGELDGWYYGSNCSSVGGVIQELKNFDQSYLPTILNGYIQPIHHIEFVNEAVPFVCFVVDDCEPDVYIGSVGELVFELSKFDEDLWVMVGGTGLLTSSIDYVMDYVLDVNSLGDCNIFIPFNVSFLTTVHMMS